MNPSNNHIVNVGGLVKFQILEGEIWRVFTGIFIHRGFYHFMINVPVLIMTSSFSERIIKSNTLLYFYVIAGVVSNLIYIGFQSNPIAGASGSTCVFIGIILAMHSFKFDSVFLDNWINYFLIFYLLIFFIIAVNTHINITAPFLSLVIGFITGYFITKGKLKNWSFSNKILNF
ncbi:rhomboid family intramembrane serine protease [Aquimarina agarivorans]|uniref:rhomboid family intramembrane serine protease n=1 Tax=Aquimarina agarivorans TaxID=980584 RepID=UPI000248EB48|nr:rhomboid family intramembrane serine protease [Aquimarina agarivorans]